MPMRKLIVAKQFPPTQTIRYCCEHLKEANGKGRIVVTGVRWAESTNRKKNQGAAVVWTSSKLQSKKVADENGADYTLNKNNSVILNFDDAGARRTVEMCYRTNKTLVNPIIDFDEDDVWDFINMYNLPYCCLYDEGFKRIGCIGCPMGRGERMKRDFDRWPQIRKMYEHAFDEMIVERNKKGLETRIGKNGAEVLKWWLGLFDTNRKNEHDQMSIDDLEGVHGD